LFEWCRVHQVIALFVVIGLFLVFVLLLIYKDFSQTSIIITSIGDNTAEGIIYSDKAQRITAFLLDLATLPVLILTIMFSAFGVSVANKHQKEQDSTILSMSDEIIQLNKMLTMMKLDSAEEKQAIKPSNSKKSFDAIANDLSKEKDKKSIFDFLRIKRKDRK
jgi:ABC-type multidrug transport system fused ATPase/permease subunit